MKKFVKVDIVNAKKNGCSNIFQSKSFIDFDWNDGKRYRFYFEQRRFGWHLFELKKEDERIIEVPKSLYSKLGRIICGYEI